MKYLIKLCVTGETPRSQLAIANLRRICEVELSGRYDLVVIVVLERPQLAEDEKILATPTVVKELPHPIRRIIGDLSDSEGFCSDSTSGLSRRKARNAEEVCGEHSVTKLKTESEGFDLIAKGGLPRGRSTLVSGTSGSAKTVFAAQFLATGIIKASDPGVFVTFEESPDDIRRNMYGFGWDIAAWEDAGQWAFVDASPEPGEPLIFAGGYDLGALLARIEHAVRKVNARRIAIDTLGGVFAQLGDGAAIRHELFRVGRALRRLGVTSVITAERVEEHGPTTRHGVEEFVSDNVLVLAIR